MTVAQLVDRGLQLREQIAAAESELADIEARLKKLALAATPVDLADADREGRRWFARGTQVAVPVIITADKMIGSFADGGKDHARLLELAGPALRDFFKPVKVWKTLFPDGQQFRAAALAQLGEQGPAFITACKQRDKDGLPKNDIKLMWEAAA